MLKFYQWLTGRNAPLLNHILNERLKIGKEDPARIDERRGKASLKRPDGALIWLHAASMGEAQSALILIHALLKRDPGLNILVTTVTQTSAKHMAKSLPDGAFHQFMPLDHPDWMTSFLDHWKPDAALWMESEFWPNALLSLKNRNIPTALINARLSNRSYRKWRILKSALREMLSAFTVILAQTPCDARRFEKIGCTNVHMSDNIKYSAAPLPHNTADLKALQAAIGPRPVCVYASTHDGEEEMIARIHQEITKQYPNFLSIIIPRHPERRDDVLSSTKKYNLNSLLRGKDKALPQDNTAIYIADTLGELGLLYHLASITYIGRSLSHDGGGGHNPLEAAQLGCTILHGPHVQNLQDIYNDLKNNNASIEVGDEEALSRQIADLLKRPKNAIKTAQKALDFSKTKNHVIDNVLTHIEPLLERLQR